MIDKWLMAMDLLRCPGCRAALNQPGLCTRCCAQLAPNTPCCPLCAEPLGPPDSSATARCGRCRHQPPPWQHCLAPWRYAGPARQWLHQAKFHEDLFALRALQNMLHRTLDAADLGAVDVICAIPMPRARLRQRGINVARALARSLAQRHRIPLRDALQARDTALQHQRSRQARWQARERFTLGNALPSRHVLIVDDVMTTGTTLRDASRTVLAAGAESVRVLALLRTPAPQWDAGAMAAQKPPGPECRDAAAHAHHATTPGS